MGRSAFEEYLKQKGFGSNDPTPIPRYATNSNLRGRGGIQGNPLNRQYAAPIQRFAPPPARDVPFANVPYDPVKDAMSRVPINIQDRGDTVATQFQVANDPEIARQVSGNTDWAQRVGDAVISRVVGAAPNAVRTAYETPIVGGQSVSDVVNNPAIGKAIEATGYPEEQWWEAQMDAAIYMAEHDGEMPAWAQVVYGGDATYNPMQDSLDENWAKVNPAYIPPKRGRGTFYLPTWLNNNPEGLAELNQVIALAEANGQDTNAAVSEWWTQKQGTLMNILSRGLNDPLNLVGGATLVGKGVRGASEAKAAMEGASRLTKTGEAIGKALQVGGQIIDEPWEIARSLRRGTGFSGRLINAADVPVTDFINGTGGEAQDLLPTPNVKTEDDPFLSRLKGAFVDASPTSEYHGADRSIENMMNRGAFVPPVDTSGLIGNGTAPTNPRSPTILAPEQDVPYLGTATDAQLRESQAWIASMIDINDPNANPVLLRRYDAVAQEMADRASGTVNAGSINIPRSAIAGQANLPTPINRTNQLLPGDGIRGLPTGNLTGDLTDLDNSFRTFDPQTGVPIYSGGPTSEIPTRTVETVGPVTRGVPQLTIPSRGTIRDVDQLTPAEVLPEVRSPGARQVELAPAPEVQAIPEPEIPTRQAPQSDVPAPVVEPTPQTALGSPRTYDMDGAPAFVTGKQPTQKYEPGWSLRENPDRPYGISYAKEQTAKFGTEIQDRINAKITPWMTEVFEPNHNAARTAMGWEGGGKVNMTVQPILEGQAWINMRVAMRQEGLATDEIKWVQDYRRTTPASAEAKAAGDWDKTQSLEADMEDYIFQPFPDPKRVARLKRSGVIAEDIGDVSKKAQEAFWRYNEAERLRSLIHTTDAELDNMISGATAKITPGESFKAPTQPITEKQLSALPPPEILRTRSPYAGAVTKTLNEMGPEMSTPVYRSVAPWAEQNFANYDMLPKPSQTIVDLQYAGKIRAEFIKTHGFDINPMAVASGEIDVDMGGFMGTMPTESLNDFAAGYGGTGTTDQIAANEGRWVYGDTNMEGLANTFDSQDVLEQLGFERTSKWKATGYKAAVKQAAGRYTPFRGVNLKPIGLDGWTYIEGADISDAMRLLDQAGYPKTWIDPRMGKSRADLLNNPTEDLIVRAVLGSSEDAADARSMLYRRSDTPVRQKPPTATAGGFNNAEYLREMKAFERNQKLWATRTMIQGSPEASVQVSDNFERALTRADWEKVQTPTGEWQAVNVVTGQTIGPAKREITIDKYLAAIPETPTGSYLDAPECFL